MSGLKFQLVHPLVPEFEAFMQWILPPGKLNGGTDEGMLAFAIDGFDRQQRRRLGACIAQLLDDGYDDRQLCEIWNAFQQQVHYQGGGIRELLSLTLRGLEECPLPNHNAPHPRDVPQDNLPINFTIAPAAMVALETLRAQCISDYQKGQHETVRPLLHVTWAPRMDVFSRRKHVEIWCRDTPTNADYAPVIHTIAGLALAYEVSLNDHRLFEGKMIDHTPDGGFFLRDP